MLILGTPLICPHILPLASKMIIAFCSEAKRPPTKTDKTKINLKKLRMATPIKIYNNLNAILEMPSIAIKLGIIESF